MRSWLEEKDSKNPWGPHNVFVTTQVSCPTIGFMLFAPHLLTTQVSFLFDLFTENVVLVALLYELAWLLQVLLSVVMILFSRKNLGRRSDVFFFLEVFSDDVELRLRFKGV